MFCYQCEQTAGGSGCTKSGVCGKSPDIQSLQDLLLFGLKGLSAYAFHARELGGIDAEVDGFVHTALFKTITNVSFNLKQYLELALECGQVNLKTMELLDRMHTEHFGSPEPTEVQTGTKKGPGILITGHDLLDLYELLKQSQGAGVNIYTHSEMLPAHAYPKLKQFKHLVGNYGGAWQEQKREFKEFPGALLATSNCILTPPADTYLDRLFTIGITGVEGARHLKSRDFALLIEKAKRLPELPEKAGKKIMTGFHHRAVLGLADKIVSALKKKKIRHFFLIGGCDGAKPGRNYYTEFAEKVPRDCIILTLACGKYRFNKLDFGDIEGIPRLIDMGQCNNAYSAIQLALALSEALNCKINELPLSFILSWFEQKAVAILLTLLNLGIKGIRLGPSLPAFLTLNVLGLLKGEFDLKPLTTPEQDLREILG